MRWEWVEAALRTLLDANRDSRETRGVVDTSLLGLAHGTTWIASWKNGLTTDTTRFAVLGNETH